MFTIEDSNSAVEAVQIPFDFVPQEYKPRLKILKRRHWTMVLVFAVAIAAAVGLVTERNVQERYALVHGDLALHAGVALSAAELRAVVTEHRIVAYWMGPKLNFQYVIDASTAGRTSIRYLSSGGRIEIGQEQNLTITTYIQKGAYETVLQAGATSPITSFINSDGNAVYSDAADMTLAYVGMKGQAQQIQIYDPGPGRALLLADESKAIFTIK